MVYIGGKKKLQKYICPVIQKELNTGKYEAYVEPFGGGGNIMERIEFSPRYFYDLNPYLISLYKAIVDGWTPPDPDSITKEQYLRIKENFRNGIREFPDYYYGYIMFIIPSQGRMWGSYASSTDKRNFKQEHYNNLMKQIPKIKDCIFEVKSYEDIECNNCLIYCDPPYKLARRANYYYGGADFNFPNFYNWLEKIGKNNKIFISENTMPDNFIEVWSIEHTYNIADGKRQRTLPEKLFTI